MSHYCINIFTTDLFCIVNMYEGHVHLPTYNAVKTAHLSNLND